jgi:hypothetical protein
MISHDMHLSIPGAPSRAVEVCPAVAELRPEDLTCSSVDINFLLLLMFPWELLPSSRHKPAVISTAPCGR